MGRPTLWFRQAFTGGGGTPLPTFEPDPFVFGWPVFTEGLTVLRTRVSAAAWWTNGGAEPWPGDGVALTPWEVRVAFTSETLTGFGPPPGWPGEPGLGEDRYKATVHDTLTLTQVVPKLTDPLTGQYTGWNSYASLDGSRGDSQAERSFGGTQALCCFLIIGPGPGFIGTLGETPDAIFNATVDVLVTTNTHPAP